MDHGGQVRTVLGRTSDAGHAERVLVALMAVSFVALAGCGTDQVAPTTVLPALDVVGAVPPDLRPFYEQEPSWTGCGVGLECARVAVPLDYAHPDRERIELAVKRAPAGSPANRIGSLLVNPGGPGGSGIAAVEPVRAALGWDVRAVYDVVGFDPRGVGESTPVECVRDVDLDRWRSPSYDVRAADGLGRRVADAARLVGGCADRAGPLLPFVGTSSAARDLDVLRAALGDGRLNYLGMSYGTELGATYAGLFPDRVGRMVLDAGLDPRMDESERRLGLAAGMEGALRSYLADCLHASCPFTGSVDDAVAGVRGFLADLGRAPLPTGSMRPLTPALAASGILLALPDRDLWPLLDGALTAAVRRDDGGPLLGLADGAAGRQRDGSYAGNALAASTAILCVDATTRLDATTLPAYRDRLAEASPTFGAFLLDGAVLCSVWPVGPAGDGAEISAAGAAPILVVGTTQDPVAPYEWSQALAAQLDSGHLLTYDALGHTTTGRSNGCGADVVGAYLLRGELPAEGRTC